MPFTYGALAYLLKNRTYLGEVGHGGTWYPAEHDPIIDPDTFDRVQAQLAAHSAGRTGKRRQTGSLLTGLIYDDRGNRMSPTFSVKKGVRYRGYVSSALLRGHKAEAGSVRRVSAPEIEAVVLRTVTERFGSSADEAQGVSLHTVEQSQGSSPGDLIEHHLDRVIVATDRLILTFKAGGPNAEHNTEAETVTIPWAPPRTGTLVRIEGKEHVASSPKPNPGLVQAIVRAHVWLQLLTDGTYESIESLGQAIGLHPKVIRHRIRLAFLSPALTCYLLSCRITITENVSELASRIDLSWSDQA